MYWGRRLAWLNAGAKGRGALSKVVVASITHWSTKNHLAAAAAAAQEEGNNIRWENMAIIIAVIGRGKVPLPPQAYILICARAMRVRRAHVYIYLQRKTK